MISVLQAGCRFLSPLTEIMRGAGGPQRVWNCGCRDVAGLLHSPRAQKGAVALVPSQTRRSGASADGASRGKTIVVVREHGHWALMKGCLRCGRAGQLLRAVATCPAGLHAQAKRPEAGLADIRLGRQAPGPRFPGL